MSESPTKSRLERIKDRLPLAAAFAAGAITTAVGIRYRNGIGLNELIYIVPAEELRAKVAAGSPYLLTNDNGIELFVTKIARPK